MEKEETIATREGKKGNPFEDERGGISFQRKKMNKKLQKNGLKGGKEVGIEITKREKSSKGKKGRVGRTNAQKGGKRTY